MAGFIDCLLALIFTFGVLARKTQTIVFWAKRGYCRGKTSPCPLQLHCTAKSQNPLWYMGTVKTYYYLAILASSTRWEIQSALEQYVAQLSYANCHMSCPELFQMSCPINRLTPWIASANWPHESSQHLSIKFNHVSDFLWMASDDLTLIAMAVC